jgi:hypothetical protein
MEFIKKHTIKAVKENEFWRIYTGCADSCPYMGGDSSNDCPYNAYGKCPFDEYEEYYR